MQYLVTEELINPGPLLPPDQLLGIMRQWVLPSNAWRLPEGLRSNPGAEDDAENQG